MVAKIHEQPLTKLFVHALKDIYYAESAILKTLPKVIKHAKHADLKQALTSHMEETKGHVERLEQVFNELDMKPASVQCQAIDGILSEGDEVISEFGSGPAGDVAIVFACQAVEHYEMGRYGTLLAWANEMKLKSVADLLKKTLEEEHKADQKLTNLAQSYENKEGLVSVAAKAA
jgi:ferritin-like metal-binding protein YciE